MISAQSTLPQSQQTCLVASVDILLDQRAVLPDALVEPALMVVQIGDGLLPNLLFSVGDGTLRLASHHVQQTSEKRALEALY